MFVRYISAQQGVDDLAGQMAFRQINRYSIAIGIEADVLGFSADKLLLIIAQVNRLAAHTHQRTFDQLILLISYSGGVGVGVLQHIDDSLDCIGRVGKDVNHLTGQVIRGHIDSNRITVGIISNVLAFNANRQHRSRSILSNRMTIGIKANNLTGSANQRILFVLQRSVYAARLHSVIAVLSRDLVERAAG